MTATRVAVVSDTHFPRRGTRLPDACRAAIAGADLLIHAGDLADAAALAHLRSLGPPLVAVHGNADDAAVRAALPATAEVDAGGLTIGVVHDAGPQVGRRERLRARFPGADLVVFGHSHIPLLDVAEDGFLILNPGSATDRRRQPRHTMAEILIHGTRPPRIRFLAVDAPAGPLPDGLVRGGPHAPRG
ncbi:MAG: metallophosphoesterase family protein [Actinomycetota bacterium]